MPFHAVVVDLSHGKRCNYHVWAVVGIVEQIVKPARRLLPHTQYYFRLVYASLGPSAYEIANGIDGKIVTDWSAPVTTYSAAESENIAVDKFEILRRPSTLPFGNKATEKVIPVKLAVEYMSGGLRKTYSIPRLVEPIVRACGSLAPMTRPFVIHMPETCDEGGCHATDGSVQRLRHLENDLTCLEWEGVILLTAVLFHRESAASSLALETLLSRQFPVMASHPELAWVFNASAADGSLQPFNPSDVLRLGQSDGHLGAGVGLGHGSSVSRAASSASGGDHGAAHGVVPSAPPADLRKEPSVHGALCAICMSEPVSAVYNPCGHSACFDCASEWFRDHATCHACRQPITGVVKAFL